ncbi:hypothetical protein Pcinc_031633 [Petrolisthes cinctipes]|uniref:Uncharacterized protein n=1 Tax=Petrolisthes cinctipes TaxID=88211 RepID=A0AAE1K0P7_PETCI|nr:hypothetical protein Pcinc_031633 [Petrolisthes cinctipes]
MVEKEQRGRVGKEEIGERSGGGEHVMTGGPGGGEEGRRKPHALPPLQQKPRSPVIATSPIENELTSSARFIGSPPPSGLRRDDNGNHAFEGSQCRRESVSGTSESGGEEERTVYQPSNLSLEMSQPRITLHTAPRNGSPPPSHAIVSAEQVGASPSSLSLRSLASAASGTLSLRQALTPPPKLVSYRAEGGAEAVQEWIPDEEGKGLINTPPTRTTSSPSIRDLPSPVLDRHVFSRLPPPTQAARRTRSTLKLTPINKSISD